jgi:GNAT superfamily N-acetyltransferase
MRDWAIRAAYGHELPALAEIERLAGTRFAAIPELADVPEVLVPPGALAAALARGHVWTAAAADGTPVGFVYADLVDDAVHIEELDVLPAWGRRGIGRALVTAVLGDARARGRPAVTLTTFRDVPWNAPFYARLGFRIVEPAAFGPGLAAVWAHEIARGLPPELRVAMRREVAAGA